VRVDGEDDGVVATERTDDLRADERLCVLERDRNGRLPGAAATEVEREQGGVTPRTRMRGRRRHARDGEIELLDLLRGLHAPCCAQRRGPLTDGEDDQRDQAREDQEAADERRGEREREKRRREHAQGNGEADDISGRADDAA